MLLLFFFFIIFSTVVSLLFSGTVLMIGVYVLVVGGVVSLVVGWLFSPWFGAVSILVFVGGLMVMFGYFLAICPNQVIGGGGEWVSLGLPVGLVGVVFFLPTSGKGFWSGSLTSFSVFYGGVGSGVLLVLGGFLLMTLISVVKVVRLKQGPFRPFVKH